MMKEMFQKSCLKPLMAAALLLSLAGGATAHEPAVEQCDCIQFPYFKMPLGIYYLDLINYSGCTTQLSALYFSIAEISPLHQQCTPTSGCDCVDDSRLASKQPEGTTDSKRGECPGEEMLPMDSNRVEMWISNILRISDTGVVDSHTKYCSVTLPNENVLTFVKVCCVPEGSLQAYELGFEVTPAPDLEVSNLPGAAVYANPVGGKAFKVKYKALREEKLREFFVICGKDTELGELPKEQPAPTPTPTPVPVP